MQQNASRDSWTFEYTQDRLSEIMRSIHDWRLETVDEYGSPGNYVAGADIGGFTRVQQRCAAIPPDHLVLSVRFALAIRSSHGQFSPNSNLFFHSPMGANTRYPSRPHPSPSVQTESLRQVEPDYGDGSTARPFSLTVEELGQR